MTILLEELGSDPFALSRSERARLLTEKMQAQTKPCCAEMHIGFFFDGTLVDTSGVEVSVEAQRKGDGGDGTVPALASAAGVDRHSKLVARHQSGYEHDKDYDDDRVRASLIDAISRMIQPVPVR